MKKIVLLGAGVVLIILVAVVVAFLPSSEKKQVTTTIVPTSIPSSVPSDTPSTNTVPLNTHTTETYFVGVPESMTATEAPNGSGGTTVTLKQNDSPSSPIITIQKTAASQSSLQKQNDLFKTLGYTGTDVFLKDGKVATKYSGSIPLSGGQSLFETVAILEEGTMIYQVRIGYNGTSRNAQYDSMFDQVLSSLSFK